MPWWNPSKPLLMYLGDFDSNGGSDHILVYYNEEDSYPFTSRDQLVKQIPSLKKKFLKYRDYRNVRLEDIVTPQQKGIVAITATYKAEKSATDAKKAKNAAFEAEGIGNIITARKEIEKAKSEYLKAI